ncbi:MAG: alpha/beta fold hydrolase BchO [Pseudomonadota bacterium]
MANISRQVLCRPHRWHVQQDGTGPTVLLIHGAGGATQSFRHLFPLLTPVAKTIAIDLPGQGLTQLGARHRCGLDDMSEDLLKLLRHEGIAPDLIVGHSAGAAIGLRLVELGLRPPQGIVAINAALGNFKGVAGWLFPAMAKILSITPFSAEFFCATTSATSLRGLIKGTGSTLDDAGVDLYLTLARDTGHVSATLAMMAQWELDPLLARLPSITTPVALIVGENDTAVPPDTSADAAAALPQASLIRLPHLGHLAHEEDADSVAKLILDALKPALS